MEEEEFGNGNDGTSIIRQELQAAIAKSMELRALYGALMQGNNPTHLRFVSAPCSTSLFSAHDYPVFAPSYKEEPLPLHGHIRIPSQKPIESWDDNRTTNNQNEISSNCKLVATGSDIDGNSSKQSNIVVPLTNPHSNISVHHNKSRSMMFSWLLPRFKRSRKNDSSSPIRTESDEVSQVLNDLGIVSVEALKNELNEANQKRDEALMEVTKMKSSFGELKKKLEDLEAYCEDLKKALKQVVKINSKESSMLVGDDVMIEGFLQFVSESRLSVMQFCSTLVAQIGETNLQLVENLNKLFKTYKLSLDSKHSKAISHHFEGIINQVFFQEFENCAFQKNGAPKLLDPQKDREQQLKSFEALKNLSWDEVKRKGTKFYSEEFSKFCDLKMSYISSTLKWTKPWSEQLLQSFFVAAKCIWLLHLLAFSFYPPLMILRVEENRLFDPNYMEDVLSDEQKVQGLSRVKIMVMPGFYVHGNTLRCRVLCR